MLYGINHGGGFVALTGEVGTGKTTLCHCLLQQLPKNVDIALILNPKLNAIELLATICDELSINYDRNSQTLKNLVDTLNQYLLVAHANNRRTVLIIDEAQNLSFEVLEQVRLLTNLETSKTKLLQIILVGQPELSELLNRRELRQLNQRITARYHLLPLSLDETRIYIRHRLTVCKGDPGLFKESAIKEVFKFSEGIPRVINIICHCALLGAYSAESRVITPGIIKRAAKETLGKSNAQLVQLKPLLTLFVLSCIAGWLYYQKYLEAGQPVTQAKTALSGKIQDKAAVKPTVPIKTPPALVKLSKANAFKPFSVWINNPEFTLSIAIRNTLKLWGKTDINSEHVDCSHVQEAGLLCLFDKGNWKDLLLFDRPVIMEFSLPNGVKHYALLSGVKEGQPIFHFENNEAFSLADVLSYWDGYYLLLWQLPKPGLTVLVPGQTSENIEWLRKQLTAIDGMKPIPRNPQFFDEELKTRVVNFQKSKHLSPDGKVGMKTIFHLDNATGAKNSPHLED